MKRALFPFVCLTVLLGCAACGPRKTAPVAAIGLGSLNYEIVSIDR